MMFSFLFSFSFCFFFAVRDERPVQSRYCLVFVLCRKRRENVKGSAG